MIIIQIIILQIITQIVVIIIIIITITIIGRVGWQAGEACGPTGWRADRHSQAGCAVTQSRQIVPGNPDK